MFFGGTRSQIWPNTDMVNSISSGYRQESIQNTGQAVRLFVAILSHPKRKERRDAIRDTWFSICNERLQVKCRFFSDYVGLNTESKHSLRKEKDQNKDLEILNATGKHNT